KQFLAAATGNQQTNLPLARIRDHGNSPETLPIKSSDYRSQCIDVGTRRHAVARALAPRLKGLNITTDLMQVRKVVTGQQSYHHGQGLRATLIVLPAALQVLW